jgi:hypothetical protein
MPSFSPPLRILTWHVHGSYLDSLIRTGHEFFLPVRDEGGQRVGGIGGWPWPRDQVHEVPEEMVAGLDVDLVLYQSDEDWFDHGPRILSERQRTGPRIYVEHDPPWADPTEARHPVDDPDVLLVHVTAFNELMWDSGRTPTRVIDHGVPEPTDVRWTGTEARGLVVVNDLGTRGRRLGFDIVERARERLPLDVIGMRTETIGGLGEVPRTELPRFSAPYRFFFHPVRYTSLGMAVCEAMMLGMPVVALATTEMPTVIRHGHSGVIDTDPERLIAGAHGLLTDHAYAARLGAAGAMLARERFSIDRFRIAWDRAFRDAIEGDLRSATIDAADPDAARSVPAVVTA